PHSDLRDYTSKVGIIQQDADDPFTQRGSQYAQITVYTQAPAVCQYSVDEMIEMLRKKTNLITKYQIKYTKPSPGPPVGRPIAIRIKGNEFDSIQKTVAFFKDILSKIKGVVDIEDDYAQGKDELR
ncbi:MAG: hypothetical protein CUN57_02915, partial [Phototrophicales bacterium]